MTDILLTIGVIKTRCRTALWLLLISLLLLLYALACTHHPLRSWSGKPMEEFPVDRARCYRAAVFESCMHQIGWKETSVYAPDAVTPAKSVEK